MKQVLVIAIEVVSNKYIVGKNKLGYYLMGDDIETGAVEGRVPKAELAM